MAESMEGRDVEATLLGSRVFRYVVLEEGGDEGGRGRVRRGEGEGVRNGVVEELNAGLASHP